jgi:hypothetical protein
MPPRVAAARTASSTDEIDRIDRKNSRVLLMVGGEEWPVMRRRRLGEHANDDPEEAGDLCIPGVSSSPTSRPQRDHLTHNHG